LGLPLGPGAGVYM